MSGANVLPINRKFLPRWQIDGLSSNEFVGPSCQNIISPLIRQQKPDLTPFLVTSSLSFLLAPLLNLTSPSSPSSGSPRRFIPVFASFVTSISGFQLRPIQTLVPSKWFLFFHFSEQPELN